MVTKVNSTTEYRLLAGADQIIRSIARDALIAFSINRLRELKLVTANFKNGYDFTDSYYVRNDLKKFYKLIQSTLYKAVGFLETSVHDGYSFFDIRTSQRPFIYMYCIQDPSVHRYIRRISTKLAELDLPFTLEVNASEPSYMRLVIRCERMGSDVCMEIYKMLILIPECLTFFKTLSRKAYFRDERFRTYNQSRRTGFIPGNQARRNA